MEGGNRVKTFDELYEQVCGEVRGLGKSIDLCDKIKAVHSDLKHVQLLLSYPHHCPVDLVSKFTNSIRDQREEKSQDEGEQLLARAKSTSASSTSPTEAIDILTHALLVSPWRSQRKRRDVESGQQLVNEFAGRRSLDTSCVQYLVRRLIEEGKNEGTVPVGQPEDSEQTDSEQPCLLPRIYSQLSYRYLELGDHAAAILNCVRALSFGLSESFPFPLTVSMAHCLHKLNFHPEASQLFHHALQLLRNDSTIDKETKCKETLKIAQALKEMKTSVAPQNDDTAPPVLPSSFKLFQGPHQTLLAASSALELRYDIKRGRHAVARTSIPPGATLIQDRPYAWSLYPAVYKRLCQHCCLPLKAPIPCQRCATIAFCSWKCWHESEAYHKFECSVLKNVDRSPALGEMGLLCYRIVCKTEPELLERYAKQFFKDVTENSEQSGEGEEQVFLGMENGRLDPSNIASVLAMTPNTEQRPAGDILKRTVAAIYLTLVLRHVGYFRGGVTSAVTTAATTSLLSEAGAGRGGTSTEVHQASRLSPPNEADEPVDGLSQRELYIATLILRLSQSLSCNAYGINSTIGMESLGGGGNPGTIEPLGGACYPTISLLNHSCNPNAFRFTQGNTCVVRTIRRIQEGEEVLDSYGPLFTSMPRAERQNLLKSQYLFRCQCQPCEEKWPLFKDLPRVNQLSQVSSYKCPTCSTPKDASSATAAACCCGRKKMNKKQIAQLLNKSEGRYLPIKQALLGQGKVSPDWINDIAGHLDLLEKFLVPPHRLIVECQEVLKLAWNLSAD